jgi:hypothetical protein
VLSFKKRSRILIAAAVALAAVLSVGFAVNRARTDTDTNALTIAEATISYNGEISAIALNDSEHIPYAELGSTITLSFKGKRPVAVSVIEIIARADGVRRYDEGTDKEVEVAFSGSNLAMFSVTSGYDNSVSSYSEDYLPGNSFRWYRIILNDAGNGTTEYGLWLRTDPAVIMETMTFEDFEEISVGMSRSRVLEQLGEPHDTLSGFFGDVYRLEDGRTVIIYYDNSGARVENTKIIAAPVVPTVALYSYDASAEVTNPDIATRIGARLLPETATGWTALTKEIFIGVDILPVGTIAMKTYYAEAGSEATAHIISDFKYSPPTREDAVTDGQPRGGSWNVAALYPDGFLGHIWAVTTDADGIETASAYVNVVYTPPDSEAEGVYVNVQGAEIYNQAAVDIFYENALAGIPAFMRVINYTVEGDPIISDYEYNGKVFTVTTDSSRDKFGGSGNEKSIIQTYKYLIRLGNEWTLSQVEAEKVAGLEMGWIPAPSDNAAIS